MANTSDHIEKCSPAIRGESFDLGCLGPALAIILILASFERRKKFKLEYCNGRPGLLIPVNFFSKHNRFTTAVTFGATANKCVALLLNSFQTQDDNSPYYGLISLPDSPWLKVPVALVFVLVYGILFYPLFACLTTDYKLIGSVLGFLYGAIRLSLELVIGFQCISSYKGLERHIVLARLSNIPTYLCILFVVMRFAVLIFVEGRKKWFPSTSDTDRGGKASENRLARESGIKYVKLLLNPASDKSVANVRWITKAIHFIYKPRPDFEFSTQVISSVLVGAIIIFQASLTSLILIEAFRKYVLDALSTPCSNNSLYCMYADIIGIITSCFKGGSAVSALISALLLLHFMKCHRDHVLQMYRSQRTFSQSVYVSPRDSLGGALLFSGYQIALTFSGFMVTEFFLSTTFTILGLFFKWDVPRKWLIARAIAFLGPFLVFSLFLWVLLRLLKRYVFHDRDFPNLTVTVDNRRLFSIVSYFFVFFIIILGLLRCVARIFKGMILGVIFLSRIDQTCLMQGYQTWDKAFIAYIGFVNFLVAQSHPVMLVFCQLLIDRGKDDGVIESKRKTQSDHGQRSGTAAACARELRIPRVSHKAVNRWFVAVTLLRNPSLIQYRQQGGAKIAVDLESINADISNLV